MPIFMKNMEIVTPGELIAQGKNYKALEGVYQINDSIYSQYLGILYIRENSIRVVPLKGNFYVPKVGDIVIGIVIDYNPVSWTIDIRAPYLARLDANDFLGKPIDPNKEKITRFMDVGDVVIAKVAVTDRATNPQLVAHGKGLGKITRGKIIAVPPKKVPRILGKNRSMIKMIREITRAEIRVSNNGYVWIISDNKDIELLIVSAIQKIIRESHLPGLTEKIREMLSSQIKKIGDD